MVIVNSPLEQFELYSWSFIPDPLVVLYLLLNGATGYGFFLTVSEYWKAFFTVTGLVSFFLFFFLAIFFTLLDVKNIRQTLLHSLETQVTGFVWRIMVGYLQRQYFEYLFFIFSIFCIVLFSNLFGLVPYTYTATSHILFTFVIAFSAFSLINYIAIRKYGFTFFRLFFPPGAPLEIAPFLILIELISYFARVFSLSIRLFANLMAGHALLKILALFIWTMTREGSLGIILFIIPGSIVFIVTGLELAIAFLQAYVFTILIVIYFNDVLDLH